MPKRNELDSVRPFTADLPDYQRIVDDLDEALKITGEAVRATMPVRTGLLKASGQVYSESTLTEWQGTIEFGEGVEYAVYVLNKKAPSEWDAAVTLHEPLFDAALDNWTTGGRNR